MVLALERGQVGSRYLLTGTNTDMDTLTALIARLTHKTAPRPIPLPLAKAVATLQRWKYGLAGGKPSSAIPPLP